MNTVEKLMNCFKTHLDSKDKISLYSWTTGDQALAKGGPRFLDLVIKPDEKLLVCSVSVHNAEKDIGQIVFGKITNYPCSINTCPIDTIPRSHKGVPQFKDTCFVLEGGNWNKNKFNERIYIRSDDSIAGDVIDVAINGILIMPLSTDA